MLMFVTNLHTLPLHSRFSLTFESTHMNCEQVVAGITKSHWGDNSKLLHISEDERFMINKNTDLRNWIFTASLNILTKRYLI